VTCPSGGAGPASSRHVNRPGRGPRNGDGVSPDGELPTLQDYMRGLPADPADEVRGVGPGAAGPSVGAAVDHVLARTAPPSCQGGAGLAQLDSAGDPAPKLYGPGEADFEGAVAEQTLFDDAREQAATNAVLTEHPDLGERVGKDGIAVRELTQI
jgi:hypothetical protein